MIETYLPLFICKAPQQYYKIGNSTLPAVICFQTLKIVFLLYLPHLSPAALKDFDFTDNGKHHIKVSQIISMNNRKQGTFITNI